jgi:cytochrome c-type biogenesis protein CcmH
VKRLILIAALGLGGSGGLCAAAAPGQAAPGQAAAPLAAPTQNLDANGQMQDPALQARFERIAKDLRCLVCQNESIADSNVELAGDLRRQVREMLVAGRSDDAIFDFMTDRYGDFVLYRPPFKSTTMLLWIGPGVLLVLGLLMLVLVLRRRSRMPEDRFDAEEPEVNQGS